MKGDITWPTKRQHLFYSHFPNWSHIRLFCAFPHCTAAALEATLNLAEPARPMRILQPRLLNQSPASREIDCYCCSLLFLLKPFAEKSWLASNQEENQCSTVHWKPGSRLLKHIVWLLSNITSLHIFEENSVVPFLTTFQKVSDSVSKKFGIKSIGLSIQLK